MTTSAGGETFRLRRFRIGARLALGFGAMLAIIVFMVAVDSFLNRQSKEKLMRGLNTAEQKNQLAAAMKSALLEGGIAMRNIGIQSSVSAMQREHEKAKSERAEYGETRDKFERVGLSEAEKTIFANIAALDQQIQTPLKEAIGQALAFNEEAAAKALATHVDPLNQQAIKEINKLVAIQQAAAHDVLENYQADDARLKLILLLAGAIALVVGATFSWLIARSIIYPLRAAVLIAKSVASGDLTSNVKVAATDEVGELMQALKDMDESLLKIVAEVRFGTDAIAGASSAIASGNADLSSRTKSQADSLEATASSMEQLTGSVQENAENSRQANSLVEQASALAVRGGAVVEKVVDTMGSMERNSRRIVDIIGVIDGIAFQTNILALNAAVEAARAGENGRGFGVVAAEVRSLAQRSATAAKEVRELIGGSVEQVKDGHALVLQAGQAMHEIVTAVQRVAIIMSEISVASQEQSAGIGAVNISIARMDEMTQKNASLVEQAALAADGMRNQAANLARAVAVFKLNESEKVKENAKANRIAGSSVQARVDADAVDMRHAFAEQAYPLPQRRRANLPLPPRLASEHWEAF